MPNLTDYVDESWVRELIARARQEDLGPDGIDATSEMFIAPDAAATAHMRAREAGRVAGLALLPLVAAAYDEAIRVTCELADGDAIQPGDTVASFAGPLRSILSMERVALNFTTHLSGIASLTARYAAEADGTRATIYDTRKTIPGLRGLAKYAVASGGGGTHRMGLYDAVLIKDNHLAGTALPDLADAIDAAAGKARTRFAKLKFVMVEVDTLEQLAEVLKTSADIALLDNMPPDVLREAVAMRDAANPEMQVEASGGVNLSTVKAIAQSGVDRISVGAITHSAATLDLGLDID